MNIKRLVSTAIVMCSAMVCVSVSAKEEPMFSSSGVFVQQEGENIYRALCQGCHMPNGEGAVGAGQYPALAENPKLGTPHYAIFMVSKGLGGMPAFSQMLTDEQIAEVVNFVRASFGNNHTDIITAKDVTPFSN
ncbi:cytochrome c [Alteromonas sp. C1M14]|uniref:c-type cytochrome n=1 Tax=Alteromonas sp. C1M14 TaxID=2841567 RepID=UPI001C0A0E37|nr:cytochrome c [Alteromonas sp. C1M14]MBU2979702.1 cytochrome c [Alteromonas sp. C1M14]